MPAQTGTASDAKWLCRNCKSPGLRRRTPSLLDRITSFFPYTCPRCNCHQKKFRLTFSILIPLVFGGMAVAGIVWFHNYQPFTNSGSAAAASIPDQTEALARARAGAGGGLSTYEQMMLHKQKESMDNATVLKLVKANVGKDVILQMIHTSNPDYDVSANAIIELKEAGVDQAIILAMINASAAPHQ